MYLSLVQKWLLTSLGFMLLHVIQLVLVHGQSNRNLTSGSTAITAGDLATHLLSPSGDFAFGFKMVGSGFLLAIWFEKIAEQTVVWSANGNKLVPQGSRVWLTGDDRLLLDDPQGGETWSAGLPGSGLAYAAMLDTGNLILANRDHTKSWDTFSNPTDTILPMQILGPGSQLVARYSEINYSGGRFKLEMRGDGNLVLSSTAYQADSKNMAYWNSDTEGSGYKLVFNRTGQVYLTAHNGTIIKPIQSSTISTDEFYQRAVLEHDGVFVQYLYPKSLTLDAGRPVAWSTAFNPIPSNICLELEQDLGSGACGFNSICTLGNDQRPKCSCPPGYVWLDTDDETKGCNQGFAPQSCDKNKPEGDKFVLQEMINTNWPRSDYEMHPNQTEDWCRQSCLSDCFCAVAIYGTPNCWKKRMPLTNGKMGDSVAGKALIKIRVDNSSPGLMECPNKDKILKPVIIIGSVITSWSILLVVLMFLTCRNFWSRKEVTDRRAPKSIEEEGRVRQFTYEEILEATDGFKEELGRGAFGTVYKGFVSSFFGHDGGHFIAVKVLHKLTEKGDVEFKREMRAISQTNHKNLVKLHGYCNEGDHRILIYEYMSNSCLANLLFAGSIPSWYKRVEIAQGVARGLSYLHEECSTQIIHCDIKPQNVLLDDALVAKISDFGLAKLLMADQTRTLTELRGTRGYVAPEWFWNTSISAKVDVYSFGMLLLELICCRKNYKAGTEDEPEMILAEWVSDCYGSGSLDPLVEGDEEASGDMSGLERFVRTALWCIQADPSQRPTMKKVTLMLEGAIPVPVPPDLCSFISSV